MGIYDTPIDPFVALEPVKQARSSRKRPLKPASTGADGSAAQLTSQAATRVAQDFYDAVSGLVDFQKVRSVALKAIKGGYKPDSVLKAMKDAHKDSRPITAEVLHQYLEGYTRPRSIHRGMSKSIHYAADIPSDPSEYSEDL